ncbi:mRNA splicing protein [Balamuthia mandrillaris]
MASSKDFKSRDDWRKEKELEEARKAGTAAPLQDEEGNDINPHIPQYIAQAPWYLNRQAPSLKHQRVQKEKGETAKLGEWYLRGAFKGPAAKGYRKGACANCGAMTHKTNDCFDRPRKKGAKWTGSDIKPDEVVVDVNLDYEGKRDRWNGYDPDAHQDLIKRYERTEEERRRLKAEALSAKLVASQSESSEQQQQQKEEEEKKLVPEEEEEDFEGANDYKEDGSVLQSKDPRTRTTIRNLRIREDTAKYLRNLSLDSAYYDPKTRSMRENPNPHLPPENQLYLGDNFVRKTGDTLKFGQVQRFAWEAYEKGQDIHVQATPSQAELLYQRYKQKKEDLKSLQKEAVLKKYGGEEHLAALPPELLYAQTEEYREYARDGTLIKGQESKVAVSSKYEEDVFRNNHTSVWGSYWESGEWGYACCKQTIRNSFCTGEAGRRAKEASNRAQRTIPPPQQQQLQQQQVKKEEEEEEEEEDQKQKADSKTSKNKSKSKSKKGKGKRRRSEDEEEDKDEKLRKAIEAEERRSKEYVEKDERKRAYNSLNSNNLAPTEEEMEAYRLKRTRWEDPMRAFLDAKEHKP